MKTGKKLAALAIAFMIAFSLMPTLVSAADKKTKTVYLVSSVKIKYGKKTINTKISYKKGFIKKINTPGDIRTFSYDKKYQLKQSTDKVNSADFKGTETRSYTCKNNRIVKIVTTNSNSKDEKTTTTYKYNKKGQAISASTVSEWLKEDGSPGKDIANDTFTYSKNGCLKSINSEIKNGNDIHIMVTNYKSDKKNNIVKRSMDLDEKPFPHSYYKATISYKKNRVSSMKTEHLIPMGMNGKPAKLSISFKYKKVKVKSAHADRIADQQWQLINQAAGLTGPHNGVEGFAY